MYLIIIDRLFYSKTHHLRPLQKGRLMFLLRLLMIFIFSSRAAYGIELNSNTHSMLLEKEFTFYCADAKYNIDQLPMDKFRPLSGYGLEAGFSLNDCWLHGTLLNTDTHHNSYYLDLSFPVLHLVSLFERTIMPSNTKSISNKDNIFNQYKSGYKEENKNKQIDTSGIVFLLSFQPHEKKEIFI